MKDDYKPGTIGMWAGILGIIIGCVVMANTSVFLGIVILIGGVSVSIGFSSKAAEGKKWIDDLEKEAQDEEEKKPEIEKKYNAEIESLREGILPLKVRISECQSYLDLGEEKITSIWFEDECKKFGVRRMADSSIREYRKKAFNMEDSVVKVNVNMHETKLAIKKAKEGLKVALISVETVLSEFEVIEEIRKLTGLSLKEARALVDHVPTIIKEANSEKEAKVIKEKLEAVGAEVRLIS